MESQNKADNLIQNPAAYLSSIMDKEIVSASPKMEMKEKIKVMKGILYSRPDVEKKIRAKYGNVSEKKLLSIVEGMFEEKFREKK